MVNTNETENPLVYAVPSDEVDRFDNGDLGVAFGYGKPMRLKYLEYWRDLTAYLHPAEERSAQLSDAKIKSIAEDEAELDELLIEIQFGNALALVDAIILCRDRKLILPEILVNALKQYLRSAILGEKLGGKGRGNSPLAQAQNLANRKRRIEIVDRIHACQTVHKFMFQDGDYSSFAAKMSLPAETYAAMERGLVSSLGTSKEDAFRIAEVSLRGTSAQCGLETLKAEYYRTKDEALYEPHPETIELLGISELLPPKAITDFFEPVSIDVYEFAERAWRDEREEPDVK